MKNLLQVRVYADFLDDMIAAGYIEHTRSRQKLQRQIAAALRQRGIEDGAESFFIAAIETDTILVDASRMDWHNTCITD